MSPRPRCLFINPPMRNGTIYMKEIGRCGRRSIGGELWPQTGLAYLAAVARERGFTAELFDAMALGWGWEESLARASDFAPQLVFILVTTPTFTNDAAYAQAIRKTLPEAQIALVGTHVTALPEESLQESQADFGILGEAEPVLMEMLARWPDELHRVNGLARWQNGQVIRNPGRLFVESLDGLPDPARDLLPMDRYKMPFTEGRPFATVIPCRGCPYPCTFCRAGDVWGKKVRVRSPERVVRELLEIQGRFGIRDVAFMTDSLLTNREWAMNLFREMISAGIEIDWIANARADQVDPDLLNLMKQSGCRLISFGIESGCQEMLNSMKKHLTLEQCREGVRMTRKAGIVAFAYFILGLPGETRDTIRETIRFTKTLHADYVNFHIATPFPGTEFYEQARANGWLISDRWEDYEEEGSAVVSYPHLSASELVAAQKRAMLAFYLSPGHLIREIQRIGSWADLKAKCKRQGG
ncbi:MAG TPA: radical SAM protein [bacterium]|nr:radical SAM protein [bacterium]